MTARMAAKRDGGGPASGKYGAWRSWGIVKVKGEHEVSSYVVSCSATREAMVLDPVQPVEKLLSPAPGPRRALGAVHARPSRARGRQGRGEGRDRRHDRHARRGRQGRSSGSADRYLVEDDGACRSARFAVRVIHTPGPTHRGASASWSGTTCSPATTLLAGGIGKERPGTERAAAARLDRDQGSRAFPVSTAIYPGHGPVTNLANEFRTSPVVSNPSGADGRDPAAAALGRPRAVAAGPPRGRRTGGFFLDFDGTLAPIEEDPDAVRPVPGAGPRRWRRLASAVGRVEIVSARPAAFLADRLRAAGPLTLHGLYGARGAGAARARS